MNEYNRLLEAAKTQTRLLFEAAKRFNADNMFNQMAKESIAKFNDYSGENETVYTIIWR